MKAKEKAPRTPRLTIRRRTLGLGTLVLIVALASSAATFLAASRLGTKETAERIWKWAGDRGHAALRKDASLTRAALSLPVRLAGTLRSADVARLTVDIKFKHLRRIREKRAEALASGFLVQSDDDFVPATIRHGNESTRVKLRLKGDLVDHLEGNKWSFRIHVRGKDHFHGMRRFSVQHPKVRGFHAEILFFDTLRHVGVLAPQYFFVDVDVNGERVGLMAVEEHFSKELLESNGRRDGVIVRFDESLFWEEASRGIPPGRRLFSVYQNAPIDAFRSSRIAKSEKLSEDYAVAVGLLRSFVEGQLPASRVFDAELLGRYLAVAELWGTQHAVRWHNQRFYLNPITAKLEPIGFDANVQSRRPPEVIIGQFEPLTAEMLGDPEVFEAYTRTVRRLAGEIADGSLVSRLRELEQAHLGTLRTEFFLLDPFPEEELGERARRILARDDAGWKDSGSRGGTSKRPRTKDYPTLVHAYRIGGPDGPYLEVANAISHDVELAAVGWTDRGRDAGVPFRPAGEVTFPIRLPATPRGSLPQPVRIHYQAPGGPGQYELEVRARIAGEPELLTVPAKPYFGPLTRHPVPTSSVETQLARHPFLRRDVTPERLTVAPGRWKLAESLIVPRGVSLHVPAGTTLQFTPGEGLIAYGPLLLEGTEAERVVLEGVPLAGGEAGTWQGVAVIDAGAPSRWSHVVVRNTTGVGREGWRLTGGVNFYRSDVRMTACRLEGNRGEDALNIIHSKFELSDLEVADTASDAFDSDFSEGTVNGGTFENIGQAGGGDGVDLSGSVVTVAGTRFRNINDKALSVGEGSRMKALRVTIEGAGTGAASKDGSELQISDSTLADVRGIGLMAYVKKPEYGNGHIEAKNLRFRGNAPRGVAQRGSRIVIDGELMATEDVDVETLYATTMRKGQL